MTELCPCFLPTLASFIPWILHHQLQTPPNLEGATGPLLSFYSEALIELMDPEMKLLVS